MKKLLLIALMMLPTLSNATTYNSNSQTLTIERLQVSGSDNEFNNVTVVFTDLNSLRVTSSEPIRKFFAPPISTNTIWNFNGLSKDGLFILDSSIVFKVLDDVVIPYTANNSFTLYRRTDGSFFGSMNKLFFNVEPFIYSTKHNVIISYVSTNGNVFQDNNGDYWRIVSANATTHVNDNVSIYNDNICIINGKTVLLEKF
jgi:hypothetical protein